MTAIADRHPLTAPPQHATERGFQDAVVQLAQYFGWRVAHFGTAQTGSGHYTTPCRYDGKGFPDLVLVNPGRGLVWFRELKAGKRPHRDLEPEQREWQVALAGACANVDVWRPSDWPDIVAALSSGRAWAQ